MKGVLSALTVVMLLGLLAASPSPAAPKPSEFPVTWDLDVVLPQPLQSISVQLPGNPRPQTFWYLRYTVINRTGEDQIFVPDFVLYTETGQVLRAGQKTPGAVFAAIKKLYSDPLLTEMSGIIGTLRQGDDNAKDGVAIWPDFDPTAGKVDVFLSGISGDTATITLPVPIDMTKTDTKGKTTTVKANSVILSKTLHLRYEVLGEAAARANSKAKLLERNWVMR